MVSVQIETGTAMTATMRDSIENSIGTIASTPYGSAPFLRNMGIKNYPVKDLSQINRNKYATEVITQTAMYEDRAKIKSISTDENGESEVVVSG